MKTCSCAGRHWPDILSAFLMLLSLFGVLLYQYATHSLNEFAPYIWIPTAIGIFTMAAGFRGVYRRHRH